jgi:hypothetical protein
LVPSPALSVYETLVLKEVVDITAVQPAAVAEDGVELVER